MTFCKVRVSLGLCREFVHHMGDVDDAPRTCAFGPGIVGDLERAFRHQDEFGMLNGVRRPGLNSGRLHRVMDVHGLAGGNPAGAHHVAPLAAVGIVRDRK